LTAATTSGRLAVASFGPFAARDAAPKWGAHVATAEPGTTQPRTATRSGLGTATKPQDTTGAVGRATATAPTPTGPALVPAAPDRHPAAIVGLLVVFVVIGALAGPPPSTVKPSATIAAATVAPTLEATLPPTTAQPTTAPPTTARPTTTHPPSTAPRPTRPAPPPLRVTIVSLPATGQGNPVTATVRTAPGANCAIDVEYKSGPSHAAGLGTKTASSAGAVSWTWLVGTRTTAGDWPVTVTCSTGSASHSDQRDLTVLDTGKPG
jgi:hypothetical protein